MLMVDRDIRVQRSILANVEKLQASQVSVSQADVLEFLAVSPSLSYNVVFLDPPYRNSILAECCVKLNGNGWLAPGAKIYLEKAAAAEKIVVPKNWQLLREKIAGQVAYNLYET